MDPEDLNDNRKYAYSNYKRRSCIIYQIITIKYGLIIELYGLEVGISHDLTFLSRKTTLEDFAHRWCEILYNRLLSVSNTSVYEGKFYKSCN